MCMIQASVKLNGEGIALNTKEEIFMGIGEDDIEVQLTRDALYKSQVYHLYNNIGHVYDTQCCIAHRSKALRLTHSGT